MHSQYLYTLQTNKSSTFFSISAEIGTSNFLVLNQNVNDNLFFQSNKTQILKISPTGTLLDSLNFPEGVFFDNIVTGTNNFYYCYGASIKTYTNGISTWLSLLFKIDQNLNIVKQTIIDTSGTLMVNHRMVVKNNCLFLVHRHADQLNLKFYKADLDLVKIDSSVTAGLILSGLSNYGNNLLASGNWFLQGSQLFNSQVMEMDTSFNVISRFNLDSVTTLNPGCSQQLGVSSAINLYEISDNKYAVAGSSQVVNSANCSKRVRTIFSVIKNNNRVLNTQVVGDPFSDNFIKLGGQKQSMRYGYIYTTAIVKSDTLYPVIPTNTAQMLVYKTDTLGTLVWEKYFYEPNMFYEPYNTFATADGGVMVCGMRYNIATPAVVGACEGFIMKLDKDGDPEFVGIKENSSGAMTGFRCYPNPATTKLSFDLPLQEDIHIVIYNTLGQTILVETKYVNLSEVDVSKLTKGTYIYTIKTKRNNYSGKFIKE